MTIFTSLGCLLKDQRYGLAEAELDALVFDSTYVNTGEAMSFRDLVDIHTEEQLWGDFGIDICLGLPMDKELDPKEYMFLPGYIFESFENVIPSGMLSNFMRLISSRVFASVTTSSIANGRVE